MYYCPARPAPIQRHFGYAVHGTYTQRHIFDYRYRHCNRSYDSYRSRTDKMNYKSTNHEHDPNALNRLRWYTVLQMHNSAAKIP